MQFTGRVTMLKCADDCLFVSAGDKTMALIGTSPLDFVLKEISNAGAIEGSAASFTASGLLGKSNVDINKLVVWASSDGIYIGGSHGNISNKTFNRYSLPSNVHIGSSIIRNDLGYYQYILTYAIDHDLSFELFTPSPIVDGVLTVL
jgi:hypothetical protein